jgi:ribosomal-protein-alanine N-acetyltransferase
MKLELLSERLVLSPFSPTDLDLALEMFTDSAVTEHVGGPMGEAEIRKQMPNWTKRGGNGCIGIWCIADRETHEKYGSAALLPMPIDEDDTNFDLVVSGEMPNGDVEVGYFLKRSVWGNGYATEACRRLIQFALQESALLEVVATFDEENASSRNVLKKVGFIDHGTMRSYGEDGPIYRIRSDQLVAELPRRNG